MSVALACLALTVYFEARSEPIVGQLAVAQVVMNRVASPRYPDSVCDVVRQGGEARWRCQFSFWCDGKPERPNHRGAWIEAQIVAQAALDGVRIADFDATHYHAYYVSPYWARNFAPLGRYGNHYFYREVR